MSGHSKWSKVKHQKATTDVVKAAAFTRASRAISLAVREGGGVADPTMNFRLRLAIEKAKAVNMPKDNIERAIAKAKGEGGAAIEQIMYEGYGPHGVAFIVETATDNRQRTVAAVKNIFDRHGGSMGGMGAVSYLFKRVGIVVVPRTPDLTADRMVEQALEAGADDVIERDDVFEIFTPATALMEVKLQLEERGIKTDNAELIMHPLSPMPLTGAPLEAVSALEEAFDELDDVQRVYTNLE